MSFRRLFYPYFYPKSYWSVPRYNVWFHLTFKMWWWVELVRTLFMGGSGKYAWFLWHYRLGLPTASVRREGGRWIVRLSWWEGKSSRCKIIIYPNPRAIGGTRGTRG